MAGFAQMLHGRAAFAGVAGLAAGHPAAAGAAVSFALPVFALAAGKALTVAEAVPITVS